MNGVMALPPLQSEGRFREAHIERQAAALLANDAKSALRLAALTDRNASDYVLEETLVALLRVYVRRGLQDEAWRLAEILIDRVAAFLYRHIRIWHLRPHHLEECLQDVQDQMLLDLFKTDDKAEFWEVRFWLCLKRRLINVATKYRRLAEVEYHPDDFSNSDEAGEDALSRMPDTGALPVQLRAEVKEALGLLKEDERIAFYLTHFEGWSQPEIADRLNVSERTVRNLMARAEKRLSAWREMRS